MINHIYWFSHYNFDGPSVRYRANYPLKYLKENHNVKYSLVIPGYSLKRILNFLATYFKAFFFRKKNSVIVIQKIYRKGLYTSLLKFLLLFRKKNTIYDVDDAYYIKYGNKVVDYFAKKCQNCTVGSQYLFDYFKKLNPNCFILTNISEIVN